MGLIVNRRKVKKVNHQPSKMDNFNRQPSIKPGIISRQVMVLRTTVSKYRPKLTFSGTSRKIDFAHISFIDRS